ncbi:unnamed protein product [Didymodactylos carnosus]|uniref:Transcriptional activator protein Pur-alpha n=1 Tax=Didymodactylos carnosus TaxID=1234261 RepID=A0A813V2E2_9BILA|nr:unnamed protein product [Didymodactylos carnosus]CAF0836265.1 unnamed protein product [Didymodactylos carnosus]CAF3502809.1 unnamed protein product [Didymodactylos carnosus]CAF3623516.1 unnamed protein product [Didymodactylos carnosus]
MASSNNNRPGNGDRQQGLRSKCKLAFEKQLYFAFVFLLIAAGEEELASKTLHVQSKRFYLDVKQNRRGRFLKIAEVSAGGRKSRVLMSMSVAGELRDNLQTFSEHLDTLGEPNPNNTPEDGRLKSAIISRDDRKYYLDLKENERGRFLRISMVGIISPRTQIAVPAQGINELRVTLSNLLDEFGIEDDRDSVETPPAIEPAELPDSKYLRVGNKNFYFDVGSNDRGVFLRISEVKPGFRTAVTIPEKVWTRFRDNIGDFISSMESERSLAGGQTASSLGGNSGQEQTTTQQRSNQETQPPRQQNRTAVVSADSPPTGASSTPTGKVSVQTPPTTPNKPGDGGGGGRSEEKN